MLIAVLVALIPHLSARALPTSLRTINADRRDIGVQLYQVQELATLGDLAAGKAHEIDNPMMIIGLEA